MPASLSTPDSGAKLPVPEFPRIGFLKNIVRSPLIEIGDFSYYDDPDGPERFEEKCVLYHYDFIGDRLVIGRFCALATGVQFIMNGANHALGGFSTFPFGIFPGAWARALRSWRLCQRLSRRHDYRQRCLDRYGIHYLAGRRDR